MTGNEPRLRLPVDWQTRPLVSYLLLPGLFFLLGLIVMGWLLARWDYGAQLIGVGETPQAAGKARASIPVRQAPPRRPGAAPERIMIDPEMARRVSALENRIANVVTQSRAAVGNADRAEGLLVAFAARRALDRGVALGFLEALLRERFGETQPQAVGTIIAAARAPVTLQELQDGLQLVKPRLLGPDPDSSWWEAFSAELGALVTVRHQQSPSPVPAERLRRAERRLEAAQVDVALAEVMRLPGRRHALDWIGKARRYVIARRALDTVETAALLEPRAAPVRAPPAPVQAATKGR
ncbi:MAG: hypothetical protein ACT4OE_09235 [Sphingosinicella sp.]